MLYSNIVWLSGMFDVLHKEHIKLFKRASETLLPVMVAVAEDEQVRRVKGANHPQLTFNDRIRALEALKLIDGIHPFSTDDELYALLKANRPQLMLVDESLRGERVLGSAFVKQIIYIRTPDGGISRPTIVGGTHTSLCL